MNLVAYFSASGMTKKLALKINEYVKGDLVEIKPKDAYTDRELDWMDNTSRCSIEHNDRSIRPAILNDIDISNYGTIYLGFPVWWYREPNIIDTFLDSHDFSNKNVKIFCTSHSTPLEEVMNNIKKDYPFIKDGFRSGYNINIKELENWLGE